MRTTTETINESLKVFDNATSEKLIKAVLDNSSKTIFQVVEKFDNYEEMSQDPTYAEIFAGYSNCIGSDKEVAKRLNIVSCFKVKRHGYKASYDNDYALMYIVENNGYFKLNEVDLHSCVSSSMQGASIFCGLIIHHADAYVNSKDACEYLMNQGYLIA